MIRGPHPECTCHVVAKYTFENVFQSQILGHYMHSVHFTNDREMLCIAMYYLFLVEYVAMHTKMIHEVPYCKQLNG